MAVSAPGSFPCPHLPYLYDEHFEPFWAACAELGMVISMHAEWVPDTLEHLTARFVSSGLPCASVAP